MKRWMLCLSVLLAFCVPVMAQPGPFDVVPSTDPAWHYVDVLQKAGIVIGYPDGTYGGRREMTRYEFAVAVARLLAQLPPPTEKETARLGRAKDLVDRLTSGPEVTAALVALVEESGRN